MADENEHCTRCNAILDPDKSVWLELSWKTGKYSDPEKISIPAQESQGGFPFGETCARHQLQHNKSGA